MPANKSITGNPDNISFDEYDEAVNPPPKEVEFERVIHRALSRRQFLGATGAGILSIGTGSLGLAPEDATAGNTLSSADTAIDFTPVAANSHDTVTVPQGFNWHVLTRWGDPLWSKGKEFHPQTRGTGQSQEFAVGDNNDGMELYSRDDRLIMAVNNEYVNRSIIYGNRESGLPENEDDIRKGKAGHGVSVFEIMQKDGQWEVVKDSEFNRKITADSPMEITGPARGHDLLKTSADPDGVMSLGTWNNCGSGITPWGTFLACEENFNGYFSHDEEDAEVSPEFKRYGINTKDWGYGWGAYDRRFRINQEPNEPNRAGYIVEIDPLDPSSTPKKRTALGRFKHENAEVVIAQSGKVVVYLGDDERGEFLYKFVSRGTYHEDGDNSSLLEEGDLFVARFDDDGRGEWLVLSPETTSMRKGEIAIYTRIAASKVSATTMDRPEWVAANPHKAEVYCCLTNNKNRGIKSNAGGDDTPVNGPNPRVANQYGQIVRWIPDGGLHDATGFSWNLFVLAGNPGVHGDGPLAGSENIWAGNMFNSPDGLRFDSKGGLWIQTDGNYSDQEDFQGMGNNQMLYADTSNGEIKRFMVGPKECEVTGITWSPDRKTMFVGIQHPGEKGDSSFPDGGDSVPRSAIIAINKNDGSEIG